jgi:hypothetical protein
VAPGAISVIVGPRISGGSGSPVIGGAAVPVFGEAPIAAHGAEILDDAADTMCGHDVALVVLDQRIPNAKTASIRLAPPVLGEKLTAVGWGKTDQAIFPDQRMTRSGIAVIGLENRIVEYTRASGMLVRALTLGGELAVGESTCYGDSGGPLFDDAGKIVGVTSRTPDNVSVRCVDTTVVYSFAGARAPLVADALARGAARP